MFALHSASARPAWRRGRLATAPAYPQGVQTALASLPFPAPAGVEGDLTKRWGSKLFWVLYWMALEAWVVVYPGIVAICMFGEMTCTSFPHASVMMRRWSRGSGGPAGAL